MTYYKFRTVLALSLFASISQTSASHTNILGDTDTTTQKFQTIHLTSDDMPIIDSMPLEIKENIFKNLDRKSLIQASRVSKQWYDEIVNQLDFIGQIKIFPKDVFITNISPNGRYVTGFIVDYSQKNEWHQGIIKVYFFDLQSRNSKIGDFGLSGISVNDSGHVIAIKPIGDCQKLRWYPYTNSYDSSTDMNFDFRKELSNVSKSRVIQIDKNMYIDTTDQKITTNGITQNLIDYLEKSQMYPQFIKNFKIIAIEAATRDRVLVGLAASKPGRSPVERRAFVLKIPKLN